MSAPIRVLLVIVPAFLGCIAWAGAAENPGGANQCVQAAPSEECLVTKNGVGRIELGMTLAEARARYPEGKFARTSDGEGLALVALSQGGEELMRLFANENDPVGAIDPARKIVFIETFSSRCRTREGIYPGLPVSSAEKIVGKTTLITVSEIESREFIQFARHPDGLTFRLNYSGIFPKGLSETTEYEKNAKIFSISISLPPDKHQPVQGLTCCGLTPGSRGNRSEENVPSPGMTQQGEESLPIVYCVISYC